jgi:hypothetical protein
MMMDRQKLEAEVNALMPKNTDRDAMAGVAAAYIAYFLHGIDEKLERLIEVLENQSKLSR